MEFLRDGRGGVLVLRGTNVSDAAKRAADRLPSFDAGDFGRLRDEVGASAVRLLAFWEAIEPEPFAHDEAYLAGYRRVVDAAAAAGLRVVVDLHQDLFGAGFGSAGAPRWVLGDRVYARYRARRPWSLGYLEPAMRDAFDALYDGHVAVTGAPLLDHLAGAAEKLGLALAGSPAVLVFDPINEPFWGSRTWAALEREVLPRVYARLASAFRRGCPEAWIALEPPPIASIGVQTALPPPAFDRAVYAPHLYPPEVELAGRYGGDARVGWRILDRIGADARRLGVPALVGEYGVRRGASGAVEYLCDALDALDAARLGALHWEVGAFRGTEYGLWDERRDPTEIARAIARPYPRRVAGDPIGWRWDARDGRFIAAWREPDAALGDTEIALPSLAFPRGADAHLEDGGAIAIDGTIARVAARGGTRRAIVRRR